MLIVNHQDFKISLEGFRAIVQYMLWFFVVIQLVDDEKAARNVTVVYVLIAGAMAIHGVIQYIVGAPMPAGWIDQNEMSVRTRVYSILTSPNIFGCMMTMSIPMAASLALDSHKKFGKLIFGFLAFMMVCSLVFTFSRGAWIGFVVAAGVYVLLKDKRLIIPCIILAVIVLVCVPSVGNRISYMLSPEYIESSLRGGRLVRWLTGLEILKFYPWMGVGLGQFGGAVAMNNGTSFLVGYTDTKTFYMDNYFLKTAVESGIIGFVAFVILMYCVIINGYRTIKLAKDNTTKQLSIGILAGLCGVITHNWVENIFEVPLMTSLFWIFAAVMMVLNYKERVSAVEEKIGD
jgi:O-antigen ligase